MPKLFFRDEWFYEVSPTALSESEFEDLLVHNARLIRPKAQILPFKKTVFSYESSARADLVLVENDYRYWAVVEVEMRRHSLNGHVIPQIRTLRAAQYRQEHAAYLAEKHADLNQDKLSDMFRGDPPDVIVLVNKYDADWNREIQRYGAHMVVFEIFRSDLNKHIFAIDGEIPGVSENFLTELSFGFLPRFLIVRRPAALGFRAGQRVRIFIDGQATDWVRLDTGDACYISPVGNMPVRTGRSYALVRSEDGQFEIRPLGRRE